MTMRLLRMDERREFFRDLILNQAARVPVRRKQAGKDWQNQFPNGKLLKTSPKNTLAGVCSKIK